MHVLSAVCAKNAVCMCIESKCIPDQIFVVHIISLAPYRCVLELSSSSSDDAGTDEESS
jgi:hypothetical protein